jgi:hypothetical protein
VMALIRETQPHWQPGALAARSIVGGAATAFGADRHTLACFEIADGVDVLPQWGHVRSVRRTRGMSICRARFCSSRARRSSMVNVMAYPLGIEGATTPPPRRYFRGRAMATSCAGRSQHPHAVLWTEVGGPVDPLEARMRRTRPHVGEERLKAMPPSTDSW